MQSDARRHHLKSSLDSLDINMISLIQKEIDCYDMISLVFLLYEVADTALERLIIYQRVSKDIQDNNANLLHDWVMHVHHRETWRDKLMEALVTCQLYFVIRKLGLNVAEIKKKHQSINEIDALIHPTKKVLYKLCENMNTDNLYKLKKTLITYDIDVTDFESCELILLDLMCRRFISLKAKDNIGIENIAKIIDNFPELVAIANDLRRSEKLYGHTETIIKDTPVTSTPITSITNNSKKESDKSYMKEFHEVFELFNDLNVAEVEPIKNLKSDTNIHHKGMYTIKNPKNVGVCLIINQEKFHPSKDSIEGKVRLRPLDDRVGSTKDKEELSQTMKNLNFDVITRDNLDHKTMVETIRDVVKYRVREDHSMFMLCVLSHGTKGHVYAADYVKIKVEDIERLLDSDDAIHLRDKPKLLILQACQVEDDEPHVKVVADSPRSPYKYYIKKSDFIIYWATAPNYEAYRHEKMGSIFIQILCKTIQKYSNKDHINDLFTIVNYNVKKICVSLQCEQLPKVEHTLMKKLYLQIPEI